MRQPSILFAGAIVTNLALGSSTSEYEQAALHRQRDLVDRTPFSAEETKMFKHMLGRGILTLDDSRKVKAHPKARGLKGGAKQPSGGGGKQKSGTGGGLKGATQSVRTGGQQKQTGRTEPVQDQDDTSYFDDYFKYDDYWVGYDDFTTQDDYYYNSGKSASGKGKGKGGGSKGGGYDDGHGSGPVYAAYTLTMLQDVDGVSTVGTSEGNATKEVGTAYTYSGQTLYAIDDDDTVKPEDDGYFLGVVTGKCTRTDKSEFGDPSYVGKAYCQFNYHFTDGESLEATFVAEGPVKMGSNSALPITGGTEVFRRAVGSVILYPVDLIEAGDTWELVENPELDIPAPYKVEAYVWLDASVMPPELYA